MSGNTNVNINGKRRYKDWNDLLRIMGHYDPIATIIDAYSLKSEEEVRRRSQSPVMSWVSTILP